MAISLSLLTSTAQADDAAEMIRTRLAEAGQTNLAAIIRTTDSHAETISYRVQCANRNDLATVWEVLRSLPHKLRISQGSNYVVVVVRTPQYAQPWPGQQAVSRVNTPQREAERLEALSQPAEKHQDTKRETERKQDLEAINNLRASIRSAQQPDPGRSEIGLAQAKIAGQRHQLEQMIAAYKGKYGQEP